MICLWIAGCGDACRMEILSEAASGDRKAVISRCGPTVQVTVEPGGNVFIADDVIKVQWLSDARLRVSYPMGARVVSAESRAPGLRVEYEALGR